MAIPILPESIPTPPAYRRRPPSGPHAPEFRARVRDARPSSRFAFSSPPPPPSLALHPPRPPHSRARGPLCRALVQQHFAAPIQEPLGSLGWNREDRGFPRQSAGRPPPH